MMRNKSALLLLTVSVLWGVAFVAQRTAMEHMGPLTFNAARFLLGSAALLPVAALFKRANKPGEGGYGFKYAVTAGMAGGAVLFTAAALQQIGVNITMSAGKSGFITGLYIVLTPILGVALGRKTALPTWAGAAAACVGLYLLSAPSGLSSVGGGDAALLAGAVFWAVHILLVDRFTGKAAPLTFAVAQCLTCGLLSLVAALFTEGVTFAVIIDGRASVLYSALLAVCLAYTLQIVGQRGVAPGKAALIFSLESLFAALGGAVLLGEVMDARSYLGCALIFSGILISQFKSKNTKNIKIE